MGSFGDLGRHRHHGGHRGGGYSMPWIQPWPYGSEIITLPSAQDQARLDCANKGCEYRQKGQGFSCKCKESKMSGLAQLAAVAPSVTETNTTPQMAINPSTGKYEIISSSPWAPLTANQLLQPWSMVSQYPQTQQPQQPSAGFNQQQLLDSMKLLPGIVGDIKNIVSPTKTPVAKPIGYQSSSNVTAVLVTAAVVLGIAFLGYYMFTATGSKSSASPSILPVKTIG